MTRASTVVVGERSRRRLELATLVENFYPALRVLEARVTEPRQLHAALVQSERLLERQLTFLEFLDDRFELRDRRFEVLDRRDGGAGRIAHVVFVTLASIEPRLKVTRTVSPAATSVEARTTRRSSVQHTEYPRAST